MKRALRLLPIICLLLSSNLAYGQKHASLPVTGITPLSKEKMKFTHYWSIALTLGSAFCTGEKCTGDTPDRLSDPTFEFTGSIHFLPYWAMGISIAIVGLTHPDNEETAVRELSTSVTTMLENRIYFPFADVFHPFGLLAIGTVQYNYIGNGPSGPEKTYSGGVGFRLGGGIDYTINPDYSIGAVFYYEAQYLEDDEDPADARPTYNVNIFRAGIRFICRF